MITRTASRWQTKDWQLMMKSMLRNVDELCQFVEISPQDLAQRYQAHKDFPVRVTRHFAAQIEKGNINDPLLLQVLPQAVELDEVQGFNNDPLEEAQFSKAPGLIHKYAGRVLLITSPSCAINCRYCFRRHFPYQENSPGLAHWQQALRYIAAHDTIQEVIFSGGDPLFATDDYLRQLIQWIAEIPHVRWLRVHSRLPVVMPQRLTDDFMQLLSATRLQVSMVLHINHVHEISDEVAFAVSLLQSYGIRVLNQSVLLKGVNDSFEVHKALLQALHTHRIQAYYLHVLDAVKGSAHFQVSDAEALALYEQLRRHLPGFMLPRLVRELPHAPYKTNVQDIMTCVN